MAQKKVKEFSAPGSKTSSIPLKNPERVRGGEKSGGAEGNPGARDSGEGEEDVKWADGGYEVWRRGWGGSTSLAKGGQIVQRSYTCRRSPRRKSQCYGRGAALRVRAA